MTNAKQFTISDSSINVVYQAEQEIGTLKGQNRDNNDAANGQKMTAYGEVIASIAQVKLVKGNLPRSVSKTLRKALLEEAGLKDATVKRYVENGVGAVRLIKEKIGDIPSQYTGSAVVADLVRLRRRRCFLPGGAGAGGAAAALGDVGLVDLEQLWDARLEGDELVHDGVHDPHQQHPPVALAVVAVDDALWGGAAQTQ